MKSNLLKLLSILLVGLGFSQAQAGWGAIAYNFGNRQISYSGGHASYEEAASAALDACGPACRVVTSENNSCSAFATGSSQKWGQATGYGSSGDAIYAAISACGVDCAWQAWVCY